MSLILLGILNSQVTGGGAGAYDLLETQVLSSSAASVTFTGLDTLAAGYKHLQIRAVSRVDSTNSRFRVRVNNDAGANYSWHTLFGRGIDVISENATSVSSIELGYTEGTFSTSGAFGANVIDILDFANSSKNTTLRSLAGAVATNTSYDAINLSSGLWQNTASVTQVQCLPESGNFITGSRFSLYGVKG